MFCVYTGNAGYAEPLTPEQQHQVISGDNHGSDNDTCCRLVSICALVDIHPVPYPFHAVVEFCLVM